MNRPQRPATFRVDDPAVVLAPIEEPRRSVPGVKSVQPGETDASLPVVAPLPRRRRVPWATAFWVSAGGLVLLAIGLGTANLISDLWSRAGWLGGLGAALAAVAAVALAIICVREVLGLARLATIDAMRGRAVDILASDDRAAGRTLGHELIRLTRRMPRLARARARLEDHLGDIIDGGDLVRLAERELMAPLDEEARQLVGAAAKRVSVVTAVSPRAAVDMLFVLVTALGLVRRLALLYGGRPGSLGLLKLLRHTISHLALTGGMAASDSLIQQVIGHGVAAKVSARLGEGVLNGLLTARLGLAAIEATRPLPFVALRQPSLNDLAGSLLRGSDKAAPVEALQDQR
jgi:putative membrane protein